MDRWVEIAHSLSGRVRLRVAAARNRREECAAAARAVAALRGVVAVRADPFTGSFLVRHDGTLDALALASTLRDAIGAAGILLRGDRPPPPAPRNGPTPPSAVGRALYQVFRDLNEDLLRRTGGGVDLGVLATAALFTVGAAEVVATRRIPAPPWFNLAWWGFRTFMTSEGGAPTSDADGSAAPTPQD